MPIRQARKLCLWFLSKWKKVDGPIAIVIIAGTTMYAGSVLKDRIGGQSTINELLVSQHEANKNIANLTAAVNRMSTDQHQVLQAITPVAKTVNDIKSAQSANLESIRSDTTRAVKQAVSEAVATDKIKR